MSNDKKLYAVPDKISCWDDIDFVTAKRFVEKLQRRITKAQEACAYGKAMKLQRVLVNSFYAKALSVKLVITNKGKCTSGIDRVIWSTPEEKLSAIGDLSLKGYNPKPLKRVYIPKDDGSFRPIGIPTMKDRAMQTLFGFALEPLSELSADEHSYGFRRGYSTSGAILRCNDVFTSDQRYGWVLKVDVKSFFDSISHSWILENIPLDGRFLRKFLTCGYVCNSTFFPTEKGIPQGGSISVYIANMALDGLDDYFRLGAKRFN